VAFVPAVTKDAATKVRFSHATFSNLVRLISSPTSR
jgi:hypothetical protein